MRPPVLELPRGYDGLPLRTPTLPPAAHTNCYIVGHRGALVVDPGTPYASELQRLRPLLYRLRGEGGTLRGVFLTHHHPDHVGGAAAVAEEFRVPIFAHPETLARLTGELAAIEHVAIEDRHRFAIDEGRTLVAIHTPGHAVGHLSLHEPTAGVLVAGDMVPGIGTTLIDPDEGNMAHYLDGLRRLAELGPRRLLPAHGPTLQQARASIERLIEHRLQREQRVVQAVAHGGRRGRPLLDIALEAYAELPHSYLALGQRSTLAHLRKLEADGAVAMRGDDADALWVRTDS